MHYAVVIDAGSSGSRAFVYSWPDPAEYLHGLSEDNVLQTTLLPLETEQDWVLKVKPGISSYVGASERYVWQQHLRALIRHAESVVPRAKQPETPIFFLATAGLRLVEERERERLLAGVCRSLQQKTRFQIGQCKDHAALIDGQTEGLYGWLGLNHLVHLAQARQWNDFSDTFGFLDMGGASAQLAYARPAFSEHREDLHAVRIRNARGDPVEWHVFVATWLGYGANEARRRYVELLREADDGSNGSGSSTNTNSASDRSSSSNGGVVFDPCLPLGAREGGEAGSGAGSSEELVVYGNGNYQQCAALLSRLLRDEPCVDEPCLFDGKHVPEFNIGEQRFVGVSEFWYALHEVFGTRGRVDFESLEPRVEALCGTNVDQLGAGVQTSACFKATWVLTVLRDGFRFPLGAEGGGADHNFADTFQSAMEIDGAEISWTRGRAVLYAASQISPRGPGEVGVTLLDGTFVPGGVNPRSSDGHWWWWWLLLAGLLLFAKRARAFERSDQGRRLKRYVRRQAVDFCASLDPHTRRF